MQDYDGMSFVQYAHQRVESRVAQILPATVGRQFDTVCTESIESIYTSNAQQVIDVHCHNIFPEFTEFLERHGAAMKETFPLPQWDIDTHLEFMENAGIGKAILSTSGNGNEAQKRNLPG